MSPLTILFIFIYSITLITYLFIEIRSNYKHRAINKILLAIEFLSFAIITFLLNHSFNDIQFLLLIALLFAFIGDITLLFSFKVGGISFLISNIIFILYQAISINNVVIAPSFISITSIIYFIIYTLFIYISYKKSFKFNHKKIPIYIYLFLITINGMLAMLSMPINSLFSIGMTFFMISDYILLTYKYKYKYNLLLQANSGFYFSGILLIILSLL